MKYYCKHYDFVGRCDKQEVKQEDGRILYRKCCQMGDDLEKQKCCKCYEPESLESVIGKLQIDVDCIKTILNNKPVSETTKTNTRKDKWWLRHW